MEVIDTNKFEQKLKKDLEIQFRYFAWRRLQNCSFPLNRQQADNEIVYGTRLNGAQSNGETLRGVAPHWPVTQDVNEIMFLLPRELSEGDRINIDGVLRSNPQKMSVSLITGNSSPDYQNIACQFEAIFPSDTNDEDKIVIKIINNGEQEIAAGLEETKATDFFADIINEPDFQFTFTIRVQNLNYGDKPIVNIIIGGLFVHQIQLKHNLNTVRFLMLNGDIDKVKKLDFEFS